jgi:hypothetical protein
VAFQRADETKKNIGKPKGNIMEHVGKYGKTQGNIMNMWENMEKHKEKS